MTRRETPFATHGELIVVKLASGASGDRADARYRRWECLVSRETAEHRIMHCSLWQHSTTSAMQPVAWKLPLAVGTPSPRARVGASTTPRQLSVARARAPCSPTRWLPLDTFVMSARGDWPGRTRASVGTALAGWPSASSRGGVVLSPCCSAIQLWSREARVHEASTHCAGSRARRWRFQARRPHGRDRCPGCRAATAQHRRGAGVDDVAAHSVVGQELDTALPRANIPE